MPTTFDDFTSYPPSEITIATAAQITEGNYYVWLTPLNPLAIADTRLVDLVGLIRSIAASTGSTNNAEVDFSTEIDFSRPMTIYRQKTIDQPLTFSVSATSTPIPGGSAIAKVVADGTNIPNLEAFRKWSGTDEYDNRTGILNIIQFWSTGEEYWYSIGQEVGVTPIQPPEADPPPLISASVRASNPAILDFTYDELLDLADTSIPSIADLTTSTGTITGLSINGAVFSVTLDNALPEGSSVTITYTAGTNQIKDRAGNAAVDFTQTVTRAIAETFASFKDLVGISEPNSGTLVTAGNGNPAGATTVATIADGQYIQAKVPNTSNATNFVMFLSANDDQNYSLDDAQTSIIGIAVKPNTNPATLNRFPPMKSGIEIPGSAIAANSIIRIERQGDDALIKKSNDDGATFELVYTGAGLMAAVGDVRAKFILGYLPGQKTLSEIKIGSEAVVTPDPTIYINPGDFADLAIGVGYFDTIATNEGGYTYRADNGYQHGNEVDIGLSDNGNLFIGWTEPDEWLIYEIDFPKAERYRVELEISSGADGAKQIRLEFPNKNIEYTYTVNSGWENPSWHVIGESDVSAGLTSVRLFFIDGSINLFGIKLLPVEQI